MPSSKWTDEDDKLVLAALAEVRQKLRKHEENFKPKITIELTAVQAIALQVMSTSFSSTTDYLANGLRQIANEVHQQFSSTLNPKP